MQFYPHALCIICKTLVALRLVILENNHYTPVSLVLLIYFSACSNNIPCSYFLNMSEYIIINIMWFMNLQIVKSLGSVHSFNQKKLSLIPIL